MKESNSENDIMNEANININDKDDINTNISRIFDNKIRTLNNSVIIRNPHHLYDQFEFTPELNISQRDNSATFSCESIIAEMNRSTPTSLSSIQIFDLKEENVEFNNNNIIVANEMPKNPDDEIQTIPFLDKQNIIMNSNGGKVEKDKKINSQGDIKGESNKIIITKEAHKKKREVKEEKIKIKEMQLRNLESRLIQKQKELYKNNLLLIKREIKLKENLEKLKKREEDLKIEEEMFPKQNTSLTNNENEAEGSSIHEDCERNSIFSFLFFISIILIIVWLLKNKEM